MCHVVLVGFLLAGASQGAFTIKEDQTFITVFEDGKPVLVYHYLPSPIPFYVSERYKRACYVHPLYGLDGEELTQDFPLDHFHHRGLFWAWPDSTVGERKIDIWALDGARQVHAKWLAKATHEDHAEIAVQNHWVFDDEPDTPIIREEIRMRINPATTTSRTIDVQLYFENVSQQVFTLRGSETENKGYGGFCLRPDATRIPMIFTSQKGESPEDALELDSPWVDVSYATTPGSSLFSGVAIFQHPSNPGYPHPGWILRHYGFLGQSWPHSKEHVMPPGASFTLRYRVFIHRGNAKTAEVEKAFLEYEVVERNNHLTKN